MCACLSFRQVEESALIPHNEKNKMAENIATTTAGKARREWMQIKKKTHFLHDTNGAFRVLPSAGPFVRNKKMRFAIFLAANRDLSCHDSRQKVDES